MFTKNNTMADLLWIKYNGKISANFLIYNVGVKSNKLYGLITENLDKSDIRKLKDSKLDILTINEKWEWLKENCPSASKAIRSFKLDNTTLLKKYPLK